MLTASGTASAVGPLLIAYLRQSTGSYHRPLYVIAVVMAISALLPLFLFPPRAKLRRESELAEPETVPVRSKAA
jgi:OFA family oxalate/formate antiporter-like MFS transporter